MTEASAPGKIILCGEHAVVYGQPALAIPVWDVSATVTVSDRSPNADFPNVDSLSKESPCTDKSGCIIIAHDIDQMICLQDAPVDNPLAVAARLAFAELEIESPPNWRVDVHSTVPIAGGLGSGAAVSAALVRGVCAHAGVMLPDARVSKLVYETEMLHHGTPSGIDNSVIAYGAPVWFVKGTEPVPFVPQLAFTLLIADSGVPGPTRETVGDVRRAWQAEPERLGAWFEQIGDIVRLARVMIEAPTVNGALPKLGALFTQNQQLLSTLGVSSPLLDRLIDAALEAGAFGAKLSGGGRGGNVIALVDAVCQDTVQSALLAAGAKRVIATRVGPK